MQNSKRQFEEAKQQHTNDYQKQVQDDIDRQQLRRAKEPRINEPFHISESIKHLSKEEPSYTDQKGEPEYQQQNEEYQEQSYQWDEQQKLSDQKQSQNQSLGDNSQPNAKMEQQSVSINKAKEIQRTKDIQRIRDIQNEILNQIYCPNNHKGVFFCANPACQSNAVICLQQCSCSINHIGCQIRRVQQIFESFVLENLLRKDQVSQQILAKVKRYTFEMRNFVRVNTQICQNIIKRVNTIKTQILESASKLIEEFTEKTWYPVQFLNIFEKGRFESLSGKLVNSLIEYQEYIQAEDKHQLLKLNIKNFKFQEARQARIKYQKIYTSSIQSLHKKFEIRWKDLRDQIQESVESIQGRFEQANEAYYQDRVKGIFPYQDLKLEQQGDQRIKVQGLQKIEERYKLSTDSNLIDQKSSSNRQAA